MSVTLISVLIAGVAITGAAGAAGIYQLNRGWRRRKDRAMQQLADELDGVLLPGNLVGGKTLELRVAGLGKAWLLHVSTGGASRDMVMRLQVTLPRVLPRLFLLPRRGVQGLTVQAEAKPFELGDDAFGLRYRGYAPDGKEARALLGNAVRDAVLAVDGLDRERWIELQLEPHPERATTLLLLGQSGWTLERQGMRAFIEAGIALARTLVSEWDRPWRVVAQRWGLESVSGLDHKLRGLDGTVSGLAVRVRERLEPAGPVGEIRVSVLGPPGLRVAHREHARREGWLDGSQPVGNPVLDMTVAVQGHDPEQVRSLLADEDLTTALLEVVHAFPGSVLDEHGVRLVRPGLLDGDLEACVEAALRLGMEIQDGMAAHGLRRGG